MRWGLLVAIDGIHDGPLFNFCLEKKFLGKLVTNMVLLVIKSYLLAIKLKVIYRLSGCEKF